MKKYLIIFTLLFTSLQAQSLLLMQDSNERITYADTAKVYYVDGVGTGDTLATIAEVNALTLNPADQVLFKRGVTWREQLTVPSSGVEGYPIVFGAYGSGGKPIINGADLATGWVAEPTITSFYPSTNTDDKYANTTSGSITDNNALYAGNFTGGYSMNTLVRFNNVTIAKNATITSAYLSMEASGGDVTTCRIKYQGEAADNSATFGTYANFTGRSKTTAYASETISALSNNQIFTSANLSSIVSEITSRSGWSSGNSLSIFMQNDGSDNAAARNFYAYNIYASGYQKPTLVVTYSTASATVYSMDSPLTNSVGVTVAVDDTIYTLVNAKASLVEHTYFVDISQNPDKIYIYSKTDPNSREVEITTRNYGISLLSKSNVTIKDIAVKNSIIGIRTSGDVSNNNLVVDNCDISNTWNQGIVIQSSNDRNIIKNSTLYKCGNGIAIYNSDYNLIDNNEISYTQYRKLSSYNTNGISYINYGTNGEDADSNIFSNNYVHNNDNYAYDSEEAPHFIIEKNTFELCAINDAGNGSALNFCTVTGDLTISYNLFINNGSATSGWSLGEVGTGTGAYHYYIYNNTMYGDADHGSGMYFVQGNIHAYNNLIYTTAATKKGLVLLGTITSYTGNNNLYFNASGGDVISSNSVNYTLAEWVTASSEDSNSVEDNPDFTSSSDFSLQTGSPAINAGTNVGLTQDILGNPIVGLPDIGAYEKQ